MEKVFRVVASAAASTAPMGQREYHRFVALVLFPSLGSAWLGCPSSKGRSKHWLLQIAPPPPSARPFPHPLFLFSRRLVREAGDALNNAWRKEEGRPEESPVAGPLSLSSSLPNPFLYIVYLAFCGVLACEIGRMRELSCRQRFHREIRANVFSERSRMGASFHL